MKLKRDDKVMVMVGRDKGQAGKVLATYPADNKVLVEGVNIVKRHTKPSQKNPRGGILEIAKPIDVSKLMAVDPSSGKPARIGYQLDDQGRRERVFKVSRAQADKPAKTAKPSRATKAKAPAKADEAVEETEVKT